MNWLHRLWRKPEQEKRLEQELRFHFDSQVAANIRAGMSEEEARRRAHLEFGSLESVKEECREARGTVWLDSTWQDIRFSLRTLRKTPAFTVAAIATLALGIGANTAIFSVTNAALLRTLPVHDPQQLVSLKVEPSQPDGAGNTGDSETSFSDLVFERLRTRRDAFSAVIAHVPLGFNKISVRHGQSPEEAAGEMVSGNLFSGLGVRMECGRPFTLDDEHNHAAVTVVSYAYLERSFGENCRNAIGETLFIKGFPFTIIGVAARGFFGPQNAPTDLWIPLQNRPEFNAWGSSSDSYYANPKWWCLPLMARLTPGISAERAVAMVTPAFQRAAYEPLGGKPHPGEKPRTLALAPMRGVPGAEGETKTLTVLMGMVGLILIIACGNIAMLLMARNTARQREFSVRLAIGGSHFRLFRQLLTDSLLITGAGASLGWILSLVAKRALVVWADIDFDVSPDANVLLFTIGISLIAGIVFGVAPLFAAVRVPIGLALKSSAANLSQSHAKLRTGRIVVALQVSVCLMLVAASGLLVGTLRNLEHINLGFRSSGLVVFGVNPQLLVHSDAEAIRFYEALLDKLRGLPGVEGATLMGNRIGSGWSNNTTAIVDGKQAVAAAPNAHSGMRWNDVGPNFFTTLGVPILRGRDLNERDSESTPKVAIINETFAKRFLPGRDPLGHSVSYSGDKPYTIVGIVADSKYTGVREHDVPMAYFPYTQIGGAGVRHIELRTADDPNRLLPVVRKTVASFSPDLALLQPMTQQAQFDDTISDERLVARLSICFGVLAVLLVATGLYGTLAYNVSRRTSEIGIRMALGARRVNVLWMILRESLLVCAIGIALGLPLTLASASVIESLLFGLTPRDPLTICLATLGVIVVSIAAGLVPARRAASVDPMIALRYE
jgi:predicted permease